MLFVHLANTLPKDEESAFFPMYGPRIWNGYVPMYAPLDKILDPALHLATET